MSRALSPVIGVVTLVAVTVLLSVTLLSVAAVEVSDPAPNTALTVSVDAGADRIELSHRGGDELDVDEMTVHVTVDGEALRYQPPVPFFASRGFRSGPEGAFNSASPNEFRAGQETSFEVATTNNPKIHSGSTVFVRITVDDSVLFEGETTAS
jgi:flagellin-like protein